MLTGVTATTKQNLQLGAGVLTTAYNGSISELDIIGATRGGGSFTAVPTERSIEADGIPSNLKNFKVIDEWVVTLNATLIEFKEDALKLALGGGATSTLGGDSKTHITANNTIETNAYKDIYWIGDLADGTHIVIKIKNAKNSGGLNITISNKGEGTYPLSLVGHYDLGDDTAPFEIIR